MRISLIVCESDLSPGEKPGGRTFLRCEGRSCPAEQTEESYPVFCTISLLPCGIDCIIMERNFDNHSRSRCPFEFLITGACFNSSGGRTVGNVFNFVNDTLGKTLAIGRCGVIPHFWSCTATSIRMKSDMNCYASRIGCCNSVYETSQQDFLKAARLSQQNNAEYYEQAILCAYMVGDYQAVRDMGEEAQGKNFMTSTAWLLDGIALFSLEDYEAAEMALTRSMDTGITPTGVYYYRGLTRLALGEYALAAQDFGEAIQQGESVLECTFNRGICYYALGENEKAVLDFQTVEQDSPDPALAASAAEMLEAIEQVSAQTTGE